MAWTLIKTARRTDPGTSHAAAADMQPKLANLQAALLAAFQAAGEGGLTSDEAETAAELHPGARRRVSELHKAGLIAPTGAIRLGRAGKAQRVFCYVTKGDGTLFEGITIYIKPPMNGTA